MIARTARLGALALVGALALAGCATGTTASDEAAATTAAADAVTVSDAWVKAADSGMSAAFGEISNSSDVDITIVSAATEASGMVQLHETTMGADGQMSMSEVDGGLVVPAGGTHVLEPGADHIMLMSLTAPLVAGDEVTVTLTFSDETTLEFTAPVKDFSGAEENYVEGDDMDMDE